MQEYLTIAKVAEMSGFSVPTLRFYEEQGLIPTVPRDGAGNRLFGERELASVNLIRCMRAAGLSLPEIKTYIALVAEGASTIEARRDLLLAARENLRRQHSDIQKCMLYLAQKISYYDIAIEAQEGDTVLPDYQFGPANLIFAQEDLDSIAKPGTPHKIPQASPTKPPAQRRGRARKD